MRHCPGWDSCILYDAVTQNVSLFCDVVARHLKPTRLKHIYLAAPPNELELINQIRAELTSVYGFTVATMKDSQPLMHKLYPNCNYIKSNEEDVFSTVEQEISFQVSLSDETSTDLSYSPATLYRHSSRLGRSIYAKSARHATITSILTLRVCTKPMVYYDFNPISPKTYGHALVVVSANSYLLSPPFEARASQFAIGCDVCLLQTVVTGLTRHLNFTIL